MTLEAIRIAQKEFEQAWTRFNSEVRQDFKDVLKTRIGYLKNNYSPIEIKPIVDVLVSKHFLEDEVVAQIPTPQYLMNSHKALIDSVNAYQKQNDEKANRR